MRRRPSRAAFAFLLLAACADGDGLNAQSRDDDDVEVVFSVQFPDGGPGAVTLTYVDPQGRSVEETVPAPWASEPLRFDPNATLRLTATGEDDQRFVECSARFGGAASGDSGPGTCELDRPLGG